MGGLPWEPRGSDETGKRVLTPSKGTGEGVLEGLGEFE